MKLSKKAEYALRAVVAMAREIPGRTFSIQEISTSERIPLKFLEQILLVLKNGGILRSKRGVGGGYQLARQAKRLSLGEVLELIEGEAEPIPCCASAGTQEECECGVPGACALGRTLAQLRDLAHEWLRQTTIADVIEKERPRDSMSFEI
ncbi:MAG: Rrf2 family transcriptional regulator [Verrucomicrobiaceae bacterium]|nr:Rrf2 family transcriptional regulator [Verrucomicrobiaceae bacterium]